MSAREGEKGLVRALRRVIALAVPHEFSATRWWGDGQSSLIRGDSLLWLGDFEVATDLSSQKVVHVTVARNRGGLVGRSIDIDRVIAALTELFTSMRV